MNRQSSKRYHSCDELDRKRPRHHAGAVEVCLSITYRSDGGSLSAMVLRIISRIFLSPAWQVSASTTLIDSTTSTPWVVEYSRTCLPSASIRSRVEVRSAYFPTVCSSTTSQREC